MSETKILYIILYWKINNYKTNNNLLMLSSFFQHIYRNCRSVKLCLKLIYIFTACLLLSFGVSAQTDGMPSLSLVIEQHSSDDNSPYYSYSVFDKNVLIQEEQLKNFLGRYHLKSNSYHVILSKEQTETLRDILLDVFDQCTDSIYTPLLPVKEGTSWEFSIAVEGIKRRIIVNNTFVPQLDVLLKFINTRLAREMRFICFETPSCK